MRRTTAALTRSASRLRRPPPTRWRLSRDLRRAPPVQGHGWLPRRM